MTASLAPRVPSSRSLVFREEAVIAASAERIWDVLADLPRYAEWNPWLTAAESEGPLAVGGVVWANVVLGRRTMRAKHVVLVVERGARLVWRDAGWNAAFVYGQRSRTLVPRADGAVTLHQELMIEGALKHVAGMSMGRALRKGLAAETAALKQRVAALSCAVAAVALAAGCTPPAQATKAWTAARSSSTDGYAECIDGTTVVGGGFEIDEVKRRPGQRRTIVSNHPWANGWRVQCVDEAGLPSDGCKAWVLCATVLK